MNSRKEIKRRILIIKLVLANDETGKPDTHVAYFSGEYPCNNDGTEIDKIKAGGAQSFAEGVEIHHTFSAKPKPADSYPNYYEQVRTYVNIISGPAQRIDPAVTAKTFPVIGPDEDNDDPFNYIDTASSRAEIVEVTKKLKLRKIVIVGLGGTGSYVLDVVAKTPVSEIHLYDGDTFYQHNAFRSPGAPSGADLSTKLPKVTFFKNLYSHMHRGIIDHPVYLDASNVEELRGSDFVFVCLDKNRPKRLIVEKLEELNIPFADAGMGIQLSDNTLGGIVRVTTSTAQKHDHFRGRVSFDDAPGDAEYNRNIQIADLNALNAVGSRQMENTFWFLSRPEIRASQSVQHRHEPAAE